MILSLIDHMQMPIAFLGTGEKLEDLATFDEKSYLEALFKSS
jgi:signal recognition particle GTPase